MTDHHVPHASSLLVHGDQPLIGVISEEQGQEVTEYFVEEEAPDSVTSRRGIQDALRLAGAWSDLNWEELVQELDRIRHENPPSPPLDL